MIKFGIFILLLMFIDPGKIGKVNSAKSEAKKAYLAGDFKTAISKYRLLDSLGVKEDEVTMNLAHSYFHLNDTVNAMNNYQSLTASTNPKFRSLASQQLGVMANRNGKIEEALNHFKNALKADPSNEEARFNYEMVKKKLEEKKKKEEQQKQQNKDDKKDEQKQDMKKDQDKKDDKDKKDPKDNKDKKDDKKQDKDQKDKEQKDKDQKDKEQKDKEQKDKEQKEKDEKENKDKDPKDKKDLPPSTSDKLKDMKMSEDKAKMVLEAMKNQEVQYLQQNKRKATKPKSKGKPDW
jgi:Ca-activated chloride channel homolog